MKKMMIILIMFFLTSCSNWKWAWEQPIDRKTQDNLRNSLFLQERISDLNRNIVKDITTLKIFKNN